MAEAIVIGCVVAGVLGSLLTLGCVFSRSDSASYRRVWERSLILSGTCALCVTTVAVASWFAEPPERQGPNPAPGGPGITVGLLGAVAVAAIGIPCSFGSMIVLGAKPPESLVNERGVLPRAMMLCAIGCAAVVWSSL